MAWFKKIQDIFKSPSKPGSVSEESSQSKIDSKNDAKDASALGGATPDVLSGKGIPAFFYRKWKDPAFLKQMRVLASQMQKDGVDIKSMSAVKAWIEKNKEAIESGEIGSDAMSAEGKAAPYVKSGPDISRNDPCPCGSGKKYKKCCAGKAGRS